MQRYHKKVYFPESDKDNLIEFTDRLNNLTWGYSSHCLDNFKHRVVDIEGMLHFIKGVNLDYEQIFEYYKAYDNNIDKVCYRLAYEINDIILVLSKDKLIVTIYLNIKDDKHETLRKEIYCKL